MQTEETQASRGQGARGPPGEANRSQSLSARVAMLLFGCTSTGQSVEIRSNGAAVIFCRNLAFKRDFCEVHMAFYPSEFSSIAAIHEHVSD